MTSEQDLKTIEATLAEFSKVLDEQNYKEAELNGQIAALRMQLTDLRQSRIAINQKIRSAQKDKESAERKFELEKEAAIIQQQLDEKRAQAATIIAFAPWKDDVFSWQIEGVLRLPDRGLLADKRGLGKTLSSLVWRRLQGGKKTLVCLRKEVASDFIKEISIREPNLFVYSLIGATPASRKYAAILLNAQEEFIVITNIESWRREVEKTTSAILKINYDSIILDEAHHIKNANTGTAQGFFKLASRIPKVLELTGTPIKNRPREMYSLLHALYPDKFPRESKFLFDYCINLGQNRWDFTPTGIKSLVAQIDHFYTARSPEDIGRKIPPPRMIEYRLDFENHPAQKQAYVDMTERSLAILEEGKVVPILSQLAIMTRQAQVVSWPAGINFEIKNEWGEVIEVVQFDIHESVKTDWAEDLIKELVEEGERIVLFSRFKPVIYELRRRLESLDTGPRVAVITGDEKRKGNTEDVFNDFDLKTAPKNYKYDVLLATYQTVGESANLNAARHAILYDRFWNPGNDEQAVGRIDRINSTKQATVHLPSVENTIDDYMIALIEEKRSIVTTFKDEATQQARLRDHLRKSI